MLYLNFFYFCGGHFATNSKFLGRHNKKVGHWTGINNNRQVKLISDNSNITCAYYYHA